MLLWDMDQGSREVKGRAREADERDGNRGDGSNVHTYIHTLLHAITTAATYLLLQSLSGLSLRRPLLLVIIVAVILIILMITQVILT